MNISFRDATKEATSFRTLFGVESQTHWHECDAVQWLSRDSVRGAGCEPGRLARDLSQRAVPLDLSSYGPAMNSLHARNVTPFLAKRPSGNVDTEACSVMFKTRCEPRDSYENRS